MCWAILWTLLLCRPCKWGFIATRGTPLFTHSLLLYQLRVIWSCSPLRHLLRDGSHFLWFTRDPKGVNIHTRLVYSHHTVSIGLIQLIKVAAVNQLTDPGPLSFLLLVLFIGVLTVVDSVAGNVSRSTREAEPSMLCYICHIWTNSICVLHNCTATVRNCWSFLCVPLAKHCLYDLVFIHYYSQLRNVLAASVFTLCGQNNLCFWS